MKVILSLIVLCAVHTSFAAQSCDLEFKQAKLCAQVTWLDAPVVNQYAQLVIVFADLDTIDLGVASDSDTDPQIKFMMYHGAHSHGTSPVEIKQLTSPFSTSQALKGMFMVDRIYLMMQGDWHMEVTIPATGETEKLIVGI